MPTEVGLLNHPKVSSQLAGGGGSSTSSIVLGLPSEQTDSTDPLGLRLFLSRLAITHRQRSVSWKPYQWRMRL